MLPLPLLELPFVGKGGTQRSRAGVRRAARRVANGALSAQNLLLGFDSLLGAARCGAHESVRAEVLERGLLFAPEHPTARGTEEAALKELLRGRSVYETG